MSALTTHQQIVDRHEALSKEHGVAYAAEQERIRAEYAKLRAACADLGHVFARGGILSGFDRNRACVFCGTAEPTDLNPVYWTGKAAPPLSADDSAQEANPPPAPATGLAAGLAPDREGIEAAPMSSEARPRHRE